jgi:hypothetical protein
MHAHDARPKQVDKLHNSTLTKEKYNLKLDEVMLLNASMNIVWCPKDEEKVGTRFCCGRHQKCMGHKPLPWADWHGRKSRQLGGKDAGGRCLIRGDWHHVLGGLRDLPSAALG